MYKDRKFVEQLVNTIESKKSESFKKAKAYLSDNNFFEKNVEEKKDYLLSEDGLILMEGLSTEKLTILAIAECFAVSQSEFHKLMRENPEIYDSIDRGRAAELDGAEKALWQLATGYYKEEKRTINYKNERNSTASQEQIMQKWFPPNPYANTYYLNNKKKMEYKDKQIELEATRNTIFIKMQIIGDDEVDLS